MVKFWACRMPKQLRSWFMPWPQADLTTAILFPIWVTLERFQLLHNKATRIIDWTKPKEHIPILKSLHWLPKERQIFLNFFFNYKTACIVFNYLEETAPKSFQCLIQIYSPGQTLCSSSPLLLHQKLSRT